MADSICKVGGRFSRCHNVAVETCQYCGRPFCTVHTHHLEAHDAVCARERCRTKHDDLAEHMRYRKRGTERNRAGLCGFEACGPHPGLQCSLCEIHFCEAHMSQRMYPFREGKVIIDRPASVCAHCWARRKTWRR